MRYGFLEDAESEDLDAVQFYEQRRKGLGEALITYFDFEQAIECVLARPLTWRQVQPAGIRRIGLSRFPYTIFYRLVEDQVQITAFAHHRMRPNYWHSRIGR